MTMPTGKELLEARVSFQKVFNKIAKMPETETEIMDTFDILSGELSPENLHCDGEISRTQAQYKYRLLMREWKELEKMLGRKVSEDEVFKYSMKKYEERRK